jgi:hypothetical protein
MEVWVFNSATVVRSLLRSVLNNQTCQHKAEDGCDVGKGAVCLWFIKLGWFLAFISRTAAILK